MPPVSLNPWETAQDRLRQVLDEHSYKNWLAHTRFKSYENGCLVVNVPSLFFANWLRDHYFEAIGACLKDLFDDFAEIQFEPAPDIVPALPAESPVTQAPAVSQSIPVPPHPPFGAFNPRYVFDRFVVGAGNRFAYAAARAVASAPARAYNPLFLYGGTGLGKTHLMQAIGQEIVQRDLGANVVFISSEQFTNQLIESIAKKSTQRFRAKYRKVDVLLIDDIHFIANKDATQEEFFHTFNSLFDMHKQIVLSSDRCPKDIPGLEERLVSRFEWGLVTDIQPPDLETRAAILQNKAAIENITVPSDVIRYIATHITTNIRELEGALVTVVALSKLTGQKITLEITEEVLRDLIGNGRAKSVTVEAIQRAVAEHFDVRIADLRGRSRQRQVAFPRQLGMYLCKQLLSNLSLNEIGEAFGGKNHATVLYSCQKIVQEIQSNAVTRQTIAQLEKALRV